MTVSTRPDHAMARMLRMLVLCTVVLGLLAPDAATAWRWWQAGRQSAALWVQVCSASGSRWMLMEASQAPGGPDVAATLPAQGTPPDEGAARPAHPATSSHWSCELSFWLPALDAAALPALPALTGWGEAWVPRALLVPPRLAWHAVQARGPPVAVSV